MNFEDFLMEVDPQYHGFALATHEYLMENGCIYKVTAAKNGCLISYKYGKKKRVILNFVFRKSGLMARVYGDYIGDYLDLIESMPEGMKNVIEKAPTCKRFEDPPKCAPNCIGYVFPFAGTQHQKCRYSCFFFPVDEETIPYIRLMVEKELSYRVAAAAA